MSAWTLKYRIFAYNTYLQTNNYVLNVSKFFKQVCDGFIRFGQEVQQKNGFRSWNDARYRNVVQIPAAYSLLNCLTARKYYYKHKHDIPTSTQARWLIMTLMLYYRVLIDTFQTFLVFLHTKKYDMSNRSIPAPQIIQMKLKIRIYVTIDSELDLHRGTI